MMVPTLSLNEYRVLNYQEVLLRNSFTFPPVSLLARWVSCVMMRKRPDKDLPGHSFIVLQLVLYGISLGAGHFSVAMPVAVGRKRLQNLLI
jgi:hypothetical protein